MKKQWQAATEVIEQLEKAGFEAVFVGGAVRDLLLNRPLHDIDVATSAQPMEIKAVFQKTVDVGIEHGTVLVLDAGEPIEVTTFRTDGEYTDHRRPDAVQFVRSLEEDLKRRDFTINAMALRKDHSLVDLFDGQKDLANKRICAVGNPVERFEEDALRMLRAIRFAAQLGFTIEEQTLQAIRQQADQIQLVAKERIAMEMEKLWCSAHVYNGLCYLIESHLVRYFPGKFEEHVASFSSFYTTNPDVGWAYIVYLNNDLSLIPQYRLSNKTKLFVKQVLEALETLTVGWAPIDYFNYSIDVLQTAYDIYTWQGHQLSTTRESIVQVKKNLPIQSKHDLAVTGHDFINWYGGKGGPWLSKAIEEVTTLVVNGHIVNQPEYIKAWFLQHYK